MRYFCCPTCGALLEVARNATRNIEGFMAQKIATGTQVATAKAAQWHCEATAADKAANVQRRATLDARVRESAAWKQLDDLKAALLTIGVLA